MKQRTFLQYTLVSLVFGILCVALPAEGKGQQERSSGRKVRREKTREARERPGGDTARAIHWRELNLSREQQEQMKDLRREFQIATASIRQELVFAEKDLQAEIRQESVDRENLDRLVQDISRLKQRVNEAATENLLALKTILSPEQREKLSASQQALPKELRALQLTGEQQMQIRKLLKASIRQNRKISNELRELKSELRELLLSPDEPDSTQLKELQGQIATKELALEQARVGNLLDIREILSPEQLKLLE